MRLRLFRRRPDPLACREFVELVTEYLDGALPDDQRARFEAHLAECEHCTGYLEDMRMMLASARAIELPPADPATHDALLRAFRELRSS
jgi:anti-sigma factor RsiW